MFSITKYDHESLNGESEKLKIFFKYYGDQPRKVKIRITENSFRVRHQDVGGIINVSKNCEYWIQDIQNRPLIYNNNITVSFLDSNTEELLFSQLLLTKKVNIHTRSFGEDFSLKNTWIVGDSHVNHNFIFGIDYDIRNYRTENSIINPIAHPLLSINRFINSDYINYLRNLPIFDGDNICFYMGEIDTRLGIIRNSKLKGLSLAEHTINLVRRFSKSLQLIKKEFPKCNLFFILPNPPIEDGWIHGENLDLFLQETNQYQRFIVRYMFEEEIKVELEKIGVEVVSTYKKYLKKNNFVDETFLIENNHHFKYPNNFLREIMKIF